MSEADLDAAPDGVEEGKRLIRLGGDTGLSLAQRLSERFERLTWRTPLHTLRLRGRYPLKLIAVPTDPIAGDVGRGQALLDGRLSYRGERHDLDMLDFKRRDWGKPFAAYVHSFEWLRDLATVTTRPVGAPIAEALTAQWLGAYADKVDALAWAPELWGRRILLWTAHAPLILSSTDLVYRSAVLNTLARGARHLDRGADKAPAGLKRIAAWCGVVAAGLLVPGGDPRRSFGEGGLARALASGMHEDGGAMSRSPAELADIVGLLAMLRETYAARRLLPPPAMTAALAKAVPALLGVTHGDRGLASWQGGAPMAAETLAALIDATGIRTRPLRQPRDWGYQRLAAGSAVAIVDAAPPPVARAVAGGCASTLAFELSDGAARLVVNCGGALAGQATLPAALLQALRSTAAHSTLCLADSNSTAINADGTLGRGVREVELSRQESEAASRLEASHDGYVRRWGFVHRRQLLLTGDGRELRGEDALLPPGRSGGGRRRTDASGFAIRFHLGKGVQASPTADGMAALLRLPGQDGKGGALWQFRCRGGTLAIEASLWIDPTGRAQPTQQLVVTGESPPGGASVSWTFKRAI
ncbi:heparinase II/III family protein [Sphingomonas sp.]|uniref:heparinase II/III family protein n=1 Tax=Sphingomonas sp. TaxID=28214 RepID=UPI003B00511B